MANSGKIIVGTGIIAAVIYGLTNLLGKKKLGDKLDTRTLASIHQLGKLGLIIRVEVVLTNPTEYSLRIRQPYVRLLNGTDLLGSSQIKNTVIEIKPYASQKLAESIYVTIPLTKLLSLGGALYKALISSKPITLTVHTLSSIDLGVKWVGYEKKDPITLKLKLPVKAKK